MKFKNGGISWQIIREKLSTKEFAVPERSSGDSTKMDEANEFIEKTLLSEIQNLP